MRTLIARVRSAQGTLELYQDASQHGQLSIVDEGGSGAGGNSEHEACERAARWLMGQRLPADAKFEAITPLGERLRRHLGL